MFIVAPMFLDKEGLQSPSTGCQTSRYPFTSKCSCSLLIPLGPQQL